MSFRPQRTHASVPTPSRPALSPPRIPSIAVLPFTNLSGDPSQEYFSDGLSDYLITELSRLPAIFVIARNSTFFYKGKTVTVQQVGRELGVRTVLQGSVLRAGGRVRINVQLADTQSGANIWAHSFDEPVTDIFAVQDDVIRQLVTTVSEFFKIVNLNVPLAGTCLPPTISRHLTTCSEARRIIGASPRTGMLKPGPFLKKQSRWTLNLPTHMQISAGPMPGRQGINGADIPNVTSSRPTNSREKR